MQRVVITGMSGVTALGNNSDDIFARLMTGKNATIRMNQWDTIDGLNTRLAAPIENLEIPKYPRKLTRGMGKVAKLATIATEQALINANLLGNNAILGNGRTGVAYGSCSGSPEPVSKLLSILTERKIRNVTATTYIQGMSHTCVVNLSLFFGTTGRLIPTSSACTSSSQAIGYCARVDGRARKNPP